MKHEEIKEMLSKLSEWPWELDAYDDSGERVIAGINPKGVISSHHSIVETDSGFYGPTDEDAQFIAASPSIVSQLLRENEIMREALTKICQKSWESDPKYSEDIVVLFNNIASEALEKVKE